MDTIKRIVPGGEAQVEIVIDRSRFIASAGPALSVEEAREFIQRIKAKYPDASHNVPVFIIGHGNAVTVQCTDDGEPSGTAGRPALAVLQGSELGDVVVVITRYFGGIKLGTGGLVRAYSDAVRGVLLKLPRAEKASTVDLLAVIQYNLLERVRLAVAERHGVILDEEFAADVTVTIRLREPYLESFMNFLENLSRGNASAVVIERNPHRIMPILPEGGTS
jgi:uncharacterized YigZ family protein